VINCKPGDLRQVIDIEMPTEGSSASGALSNPPWTLFVTVMAKIETATGNESLLGAEFISEKTHDVFCRYIPNLTTKMRINFRTQQQRTANQPGRLFRVLKFTDVNELHVETDIMAQEAVRGWGL
jgi:head-tail adaptor